MNIKHTPGPWHIEKNMLTAINSAPSDGPYKHIAMVNYYRSSDPTTDVSGEEHQANVNLIAAAPELLAALEESQKLLTEAIGNLPNPGYGWLESQVDARVIRNRAIIAKAKGEQP
jgi:hypothetical protein